MPRDYSDLSKEQLIALLERRDRERRLGLVWEREAIERDRAVNTDFVTLDEVSDLSRPGAAGARNLVIEGDNYDALRALRMTHKGKVKCIYIDPPYNTGAKDWVYNDRYVAKEDRYRHSLWLEFMHQRLTLARDLLREDGVLLVSIDDREFGRLKVLLDEVFLPLNFSTTFIWESDGNFDNQAPIKVNHEYIILFWKNREYQYAPPIIDPNIPDDSKLLRDIILNSAVKNGAKNPPSSIALPVGFPATFEAGGIGSRRSEWPRYDRPVHVEGYKLAQAVTAYTGWANANLLRRFIRNGCTPVLDNNGQETTFRITKTGAIEYVKVRKEEHSYVLSVLRNFGNPKKEGLELDNLGLSFPYPKPVKLLRYLLACFSQHNDLILDFFAGSGTTAHAAMALDQEEGVAPEAGRRWIMVSSTEATAEEPEKNLARDVLRERIVRAADKLGRAPDFAYLRCRRVAQEDIAYDVDGPDVWRLIQLRHDLPLAPFDPGAAVHQAIGRERVVYLDAVTAETAEVVEAALSEEAGARPVHVYSWTAGLLRERFEGRATLLQLPGALEAGFRT